MAKSKMNSLLHSYIILFIHSVQIVDRFSKQDFLLFKLIRIYSFVHSFDFRNQHLSNVYLHHIPSGHRSLRSSRK